MPDPVEGSAFRAIMGQVPSPVVVVTARGKGKARGITIGSFTSVALDPPLVSFNVGRDARMYEVMEACSHFAVHVLSERQVALAKRFSVPGLSGAEQFEGLAYSRVHGTPILEGGRAILHCVPHDDIEAGDHTLYVGLVVDLDARPEPGAVLYHEGTYRGVGRELPSTELSPVNRVSSESS